MSVDRDFFDDSFDPTRNEITRNEITSETW